jgi:hypothetical protein
MREIKDISKKEFLKAFNSLRSIWGKSADLKELAGVLGVIPGDLRGHIRNRIFIKIGIYGYGLSRDYTRINRFKRWGLTK